MKITKDDLIRDIKKLGICKGDTLLMHSSMKSLGGIVEGSCAAVIESFISILGQNGTLLMPALTYSTVTKQSPYFSVCRTPSCVGQLTEAFRVTHGVVRSVHPTHSVCAFGRYAEDLTENHINDLTPVGSNSPFQRIKEYGGKILMLGCGLMPNTFMHGVEEEAAVDYVLSPHLIDFTCELANGNCITATHTPHNFTGVVQRYDRVASLLSGTDIQQGKIAKADCYLLDCNALWKKALEKMRETPLFFVDKTGN